MYLLTMYVSEAVLDQGILPLYHLDAPFCVCFRLDRASRPARNLSGQNGWTEPPRSLPFEILFQPFVHTNSATSFVGHAQSNLPCPHNFAWPHTKQERIEARTAPETPVAPRCPLFVPLLHKPSLETPGHAAARQNLSTPPTSSAFGEICRLMNHRRLAGIRLFNSPRPGCPKIRGHAECPPPRFPWAGSGILIPPFLGTASLPGAIPITLPIFPRQELNSFRKEPIHDRRKQTLWFVDPGACTLQPEFRKSREGRSLSTDAAFRLGGRPACGSPRYAPRRGRSRRQLPLRSAMQ